MPALHAFGRRWQVGSDDFVPPGILDVTVKFCWFVTAVIIYLKNDANFNLEFQGCPSGRHIRIYMFGIFANLLLIILVDLVALKTTMTSYIMDTKSRRFLTPCIYIRLICEAVDVCWNLLGTLWVYGGTLNCTEAPEALAFIKRFIICNWFSVVILALFMLCLFDPLGDRKYFKKSSHSDNHPNSHPNTVNTRKNIVIDPFNLSSDNYYTKHEAFWTKKWRKMCCYFGGGDKETIDEGFQEIGKIFSTILKDHDFVTTDVIAGFICLYQREQEKKEREENERNSLADNYKKLVESLENQNTHRTITRQPLHNPHFASIVVKNMNIVSHEEYDNRYGQNLSGDSIEDIVLVNHYLSFVLGSYGWPGFISNHYKNRAIRRLWKQCECCSCFRSQNFKVVGDNCCLCNTSALKETAKLESKDLVYVSFENKIYQPIFYVAVDHKTKSFVISIQGTMSLVDLVTDVTAMPKSVDAEIPGLPSHFKAFHGVTLCAINIRKTLVEKKILEDLKAQYPDYNLVFIGMSMGAGTATILGMMFLTQFPQLKVFAVSPLGGLLSVEAAKFCESFTLSVVYGDDLVPRLSLPSIERLKSKIIQAIVDSRTPKYQILLGGCACLFCGKESKIKFSEADENNQQNSNNSNNKYAIKTVACNRILRKRTVLSLPEHETNYPQPQIAFGSKQEVPTKQNGRTATREKSPSGFLSYPMFMPGRILHITERQNWSELQGGLRYQMRFADRSEFGEIVISPRMYKDHLHFRLEKALREFVVANRDEIHTIFIS